jgi:5'-3' exonuclease
MGIKGLPEVLRPWLTPVEVSKYKGKRAAVDAYSWLHKGAYSCALELGTGEKWWVRQKRDAPYVRYCLHRAQMLRHFGVTPVIVFDGDRLPAKGNEEAERRERRAEAKRKGNERLAAKDRDGAAFAFSQGLDVTPAMAHELIAALKREGFEFVVAPYEADAQIAALAAMGGGEPGGVDIVFTEDSDLVAYACPTVLFKLDKFGNAQELRIADVLAGPPGAQPRGGGGQSSSGGADGGGGGGRGDDAAAKEVVEVADDDDGEEAAGAGAAEDGEDDEDDDEIAVTTGRGRGRGKGKAQGSGGRKGRKTPTKAKKKGGGGGGAAAAKGPLNFAGWTHELFLGLCVLSGCDFLPNVRGIGIKKAHALVRKHRTIQATLAVMYGDKKIVMPPDYDKNFQRAFWTFRHARVYDPALRRLRPLNPMPRELEALGEAKTTFLGGVVDAAAAVEVAEGRLDPITRRPFVVPPSPQKQRGWRQPRGGGGGGGGGGVGGRDSGAAAAPRKPPTAFVNLFAAKPAEKAKTIGGGDGGGGGGGGLDFDSQADVDDDAAMAAMMDTVEKHQSQGVGGDRSKAAEAAAAAALRRNDPGAEEAWTPAPHARQARGDGGGSLGPTSAIPAAYAMPDTARSAAGPPGSATRDDADGDDGGGGGKWGFERASGGIQRPTWQQPAAAAANAPANKFARAAPARRAGGNVLSSLFAAAEAKKQRQQPEAPHQAHEARTFATAGVSSAGAAASSAGPKPFARLGVGGGGSGGGSGGGFGGGGATAAAPPKPGTMHSFFSRGAGAGGGGGKRSAEGEATGGGGGDKVWDKLQSVYGAQSGKGKGKRKKI